MHQQAIPVPTRDAASLASTICREGAQQGLQFIEVSSQQPPQEAVGEGHYFLFEVWLGADVEPVRLVHRAATTGPRIPLHFGRKLLADVLQIPQRAHWKACEQSQDMETAACRCCGRSGGSADSPPRSTHTPPPCGRRPPPGAYITVLGSSPRGFPFTGRAAPWPCPSFTRAVNKGRTQQEGDQESNAWFGQPGHEVSRSNT